MADATVNLRFARMLGLSLALLTACGSRGLRRSGPDALGIGGTVQDGSRGDAGPGAAGSGGAGGSGAGGSVSAPEMPDALAGDAPRTGSDAGLPDAGAELRPPDQDPQLAAFCAGAESKISYDSKSSVIAVTTKETSGHSTCCTSREARLHTQQAIGEDVDVVVSIWIEASPGTYHVGNGSSPIGASLHKSSEVPYLQRLIDSTLVGSVTLTEAVAGQPWRLGLCVSLPSSSLRYPGLRIYVPGVPMAPESWESRLGIWLLKDASLTGKAVDGADLNTLELASEPLIDLMDIDFVEPESRNGELGTSMWMGLNTDFQLGKQLRTKIGSPVSLSGVPFVVEADGERIYLGAFATGFSSFAIHGPEVMVEEIRDEGFPIYPPVNFVPRPADLRSDPRILKVLTEAGKLAP